MHVTRPQPQGDLNVNQSVSILSGTIENSKISGINGLMYKSEQKDQSQRLHLNSYGSNNRPENLITSQQHPVNLRKESTERNTLSQLAFQQMSESNLYEKRGSTTTQSKHTPKAFLAGLSG